MRVSSPGSAPRRDRVLARLRSLGFAEVVRPRDLKGPTNARVLVVAQRVRLGVASAFAVGILFAPAFSLGERLVLSGLALGYALVSALFEGLAGRYPHFPANVVTPVLGIVIIFSVTLILPATMTAALFFYILGITFYTCVSGLTHGFWLSLVVLPCAITANVLAPRDDAVNTFALVMFCLLLPSLAVTIEALTQERRRTAARLARLHDALRAVAVTPDLQATLDSIVDSIRDASGATAAGILLRDHDHLVVAAPAGATAPFPDVDVEYYTNRELALGDDSPLTRAMRRLEPVVVANVHDDVHFARWSELWGDTLRRFGFSSLVAVPLHTGGTVIGVLNAVFDRPGALDRDELALFETYAEQVSLVIARSQAYERERQAAEQLAATDRLRSEFLSVVSHELRTPLTSVKGFVDTVLLHWDRLPETQRRELLTRVASNAEDLTRLVNQLLDFARIDAGHVRLVLEPLALRPVLDDLLRDIAPIVSEHPVQVAVPDEAVIVADKDGLTRIIVNLLTNAVRFSEPGSPIDISARIDEMQVIVSVTDRGVGIAPEEQGQIFERFYQSEPFAGARRGTGIGLTIARYFTELQGGRIWVESAPGKGSTFWFTVPSAARARAAVAADRNGAEAHVSVSRTANPNSAA